MHFTKRQALRALYYTLFLLAVVLLQTTVIPRIFPRGWRPQLLLAAVLSVSVFRGPVTGAVFGAVLGFFVDATAGELVGYRALLLMAAGIASGWLCEEQLRKGLPATLLLFAGCIGLLVAGQVLLAVFILGDTSRLGGDLLQRLREAVLSLPGLGGCYFLLAARDRHNRRLQLELDRLRRAMDPRKNEN